MKYILAFPLAIAISMISSLPARSQAREVRVQIKNELTGAPLDVTIAGIDETSIRRNSTGDYIVAIPSGDVPELTVTRDGYFDETIRLDNETEKSREVKLKPGVPQLKITILDDETSKTLTSTVDLFTMDESSIVFSEEVEVSPYTIDLEYDKVHVLQVRCPGYFSYKDTINLAKVFDGREKERKIKLVPLKTGNKISLNNIYFQPNEADLTSFAKIMLVELTHILQLEKSLVIEIGAHTDGMGTNEYNQSLSEKRAMSVKKYLLEKGAAEKQLLTKGYGESFPIAANDTEGNRALNRRVEFKIISVN